ncbi:MAG: BolA family protein [Mariprofundales bacterium]|nr:BolA family protein [Mariprofundales bacterium]
MERIRQCLQAELNPSLMELSDDSARHAGHRQQATHGGGHFCLIIASEQFLGQGKAACHRMVYRALGLMFSEEIHALSINIVEH